MTTTDPKSTDFTNDFNQLTADAAQYNTMAQQLKDSRQAYADRYKQINEAYLHGGDGIPELYHNPMLFFAMFMYLMSNQGCSEMDLGLGVQGSGLQIQGDLTKLGNDLENITNNKNDTGRDGVREEATDLNKILDTLSGKDQKIGNTISQAIGGTATSSLFDSYKTIRSDIYVDGDTSIYNPTEVDPTQSKGRTYHFSAGGKYKDYYIQSYGTEPGTIPVDKDGKRTDWVSNFGGLQWAMQQQGDPGEANEAAKKKTDAFNMNTSTTQATQAAANEYITVDKNRIQSIQSFITNMCHSTMDLVKASVQQTSK